MKASARILLVFFLIFLPVVPQTVFSLNREPDWQFPTGGELMGDPVSGDDGTIYALSEDRHLYALDPRGRLLWKHYLKNLPLGDLTVGVDGTVYAGLSNGELAAVNPSGREIWRYQLDSPLMKGVSVSSEGFIFAGTDRPELICLDHRGRRRWKVTLPAPLAERVTVVPGWGILCPLQNQRVLALTPSGEQKWIFLMAGVPGAPVPHGDGIYAASSAGTLVRLGWDGTLVWSRSQPFSQINGPYPIDGLLYFLSTPPSASSGSPGFFLGIDPVTGEPPEPGLPLPAGSLGFARGAAFLYNAGGTLFVLSGGQTGARQITIDTRIKGSLVHPGGFFIAACRDWKIKAYDLGFSPLSGWNQSGGGEARRSLALPPPPEILPPPSADELILRARMSGTDLAGKLFVLREIKRGLEQKLYTGCEGWIQELLIQLAGTGLLDPVYDAKKVINDYPQVRRDAAQLLAGAGTLVSQKALEAIFLYEWEVSGRAAQAAALGALGSDYSGSITRALLVTFKKTGSGAEKNRLADIYLDALKNLAVYYGGLPDPAGGELIREIFRGDYGRRIKDKALDILRL